MDALNKIDKLKSSPKDDEQLQAMIQDCNALIDRYNSLIEAHQSSPLPGSAAEEDAQALYIQIVNYKKKIEKIKMGY